VKISNIATQRQQVLNAVQIQGKYKILYGMPIETKIETYTAFEVSPQAFSEAPNTATRTEFLLIETRATIRISKKSLIASYYLPIPSAGYNYIGQGPNPMGSKTGRRSFWSDFSSVGLNLKVPIFWV
jgi:hypothetical protein